MKTWIEHRILDFLNRVSVADIVSGVQDAPGSGGKTIGETVATRILDRRRSLPRRRFSSITELNGIEGLGEDKMNDLVHTFGKPADEAFIDNMYNGVIYRENFELVANASEFENEEAFLEVVSCESRFTEFVAEKVKELVQQKHNSRKLAQSAAFNVKNSWLEHTKTADEASYYLAYWFYRFDADNWFSFDRVRTECAMYLEYLWRTEDRLELKFFKGFDNFVLVDAISPDDLPVVVNYGERKITVWTGSLSD